MESQLFIYQESTSLVKPAVTPLAVKKAPMKAFPGLEKWLHQDRPLKSVRPKPQWLLQQLKSQRLEKKIPVNPKAVTSKGSASKSSKTPTSRKKVAASGKESGCCTPWEQSNYSWQGEKAPPAAKAKRVAGEMPSPTPMSVVRKPLYKYLDDLEFSL